MAKRPQCSPDRVGLRTPFSSLINYPRFGVLVLGLVLTFYTFSSLLETDLHHLPIIPSSTTTSPSSPIRSTSTKKKLHGRFLHITDLHFDHFYKAHSDTASCHHGSGPAGAFGSPTEGCDSPLLLINATFNWIEQNLRDHIDFVIWTGDSARHDNDEHIPRSEDQIISQNNKMVSFFEQTFMNPSGLDDPAEYSIPIVPNIGNNDVLPHNIFLPGPNVWTDQYLETWRNFIPEEQRHVFQRGGWFHVEVIPRRLAVFSLNTMFFFTSNSAVDGCAVPTEPGYEQFEWLRIQLQMIREQGMKAILMGHVPPARTESKASWEETCWQKFTLWQHQFRDVIISSHFGHMNIDHFILQDYQDLLPDTLRGRLDRDIDTESAREAYPHDCAFWAQGANSYLMDLRKIWARLPSYGRACKSPASKECATQFGGPLGEGFGLTFVSPSVIPTFFPSLRVFEYNVTGISSPPVSQHTVGWWEKVVSLIFQHDGVRSISIIQPDPTLPPDVNSTPGSVLPFSTESKNQVDDDIDTRKRKRKSHKKRPKKAKKYHFTVPSDPPLSSLPGPAYSPQTLSLLGYRQYFANITETNDLYDHQIKHHSNPSGNFTYQLEYSTFDDHVLGLSQFTVKSFLMLAHRVSNRIGPQGIGGDDVLTHLPQSQEPLVKDQSTSNEHNRLTSKTNNAGTTKKKHKKKKEKKEKENKVWLYFVQRALVSTLTRQAVRDKFT